MVYRTPIKSNQTNRQRNNQHIVHEACLTAILLDSMNVIRYSWCTNKHTPIFVMTVHLFLCVRSNSQTTAECMCICDMQKMSTCKGQRWNRDPSTRRKRGRWPMERWSFKRRREKEKKQCWQIVHFQRILLFFLKANEIFITLIFKCEYDRFCAHTPVN